MVRRLEAEIHKRGLWLHKVGHGWTCLPFGVEARGWFEMEERALPDAIRPYLAQIRGKRGLWNNLPLNTNLCYSDPAVQQRMAESVAAYCANHPDVDIVHIWLADDSNNQCECDACSQLRPSDYYVQILNRIDRLLTQQGSRTRIVFLVYVDLLWAPVQERIENQNRFILMFAPITRTYSRSFAEETEDDGAPVPPYNRNKLIFPKSVPANMALLRGWQSWFHGDSFDFDYHLWMDHYRDPGYYQSARVLQQDMTHLADISLNGLVSCQGQRVSFPTGLPMWVMAGTLWNRMADFATLSSAYFRQAFGEDGPLAEAYLERLSDAFDPAYLRGGKGTS